MANLDCQLELPESGSLTVGQVFNLNCQGEMSELKTEQLDLKLDAKDKYKLKLLKAEATPDKKLILKVTSYQVGAQQIQAAQLVDGEHSLTLNPLQFEVKSVIDPQDPPAGPYGPVGPFDLSIPAIYWWGLGIFIAAVILAIVTKIIFKLKRKALMEELVRFETHLTPYNQFHQTLRRLQREYRFFTGIEVSAEEIQKFIIDIDQTVRIYIGRSQKIPTLKVPARRIFKEFKSEHVAETKKLFQEIDRSRENTQISGRDCAQLLNMSRDLVEKLEAEGGL